MKKKRALLKLLGVFSLVRGYNIAFVCVAQYLAAIFVLSHKSWREVVFDDSLLMLVIAGALAIAGGYIINGFYDKDKDLINKPLKTMIDLLVSQNTCLTLYFLLNFLSVIVASYVSFRAVLFFSGYIFAMWLYSHRIKKLLFLGNITSAVLSIIPFFAVFIYYRQFDTVIFFHAMVIYLLMLIREFTKDLQNIKGDLTHNYATIAVVYGERYAKGMITLMVLLCFIPVYVLINYMSVGRLVYFFEFMVLYLLLFVIVLWSSQKQVHYAWLYVAIKVLIVMGVFVQVLGNMRV